MPDTVFPDPKMNDRLTRLWEDLLADPVPPHPAPTQREPIPASHAEGPKDGSPGWSSGLISWLHRLVELEEGRAALPAAEEANSEPSPFRWVPKRAGMSAAGRSKPPFSRLTEARHVAPRRPRIPIRPLHKQPFYRRWLFYLRRWLSSSVWQESDPAA